MNKTNVIIILSIFIVSCSSFNPERIAPNYFKAYANIKGSLFGYEDYVISREIVQKIPYASMYLKIGKGSAGLLILEEILGKNFTRKLSIQFNNFKKILGKGKWKVREVTPPELRNIKHSVNFSYSMEKILPKLSSNSFFSNLFQSLYL